MSSYKSDRAILLLTTYSDSHITQNKFLTTAHRALSDVDPLSLPLWIHLLPQASLLVPLYYTGFAADVVSAGPQPLCRLVPWPQVCLPPIRSCHSAGVFLWCMGPILRGHSPQLMTDWIWRINTLFPHPLDGTTHSLWSWAGLKPSGPVTAHSLMLLASARFSSLCHCPTWLAGLPATTS